MVRPVSQWSFCLCYLLKQLLCCLLLVVSLRLLRALGVHSVNNAELCGRATSMSGPCCCPGDFYAILTTICFALATAARRMHN